MMKLNIQLFAVSKSTTFKETIDEINNESDLTITIKFSAGNSVTFFTNETLSCTCNGTTKTATVSLSTGGTVTKSFTFTNIKHNADGTKKVNWSWKCATGTSVLGTISSSGTKTLTTIPRASKVYATDCDIGKFSTILITKYKNSFTTSLYYKIPQDSDYVLLAEKTDITSFPFVIPEEWYEKIPNDKSMTCEIKAVTYNEESEIGSNTTTFVITANEELCKPSISAVVEDTNEKAIALTGSNQRYVRYISLPKITWTKELKNHATLLNETIDGIEVESPYIVSEWKNTMSLKVTDSRNYHNEITISSYGAPTDRPFYGIALDTVDYFLPTIAVSGTRVSPTSNNAIMNIEGSFYNNFFDKENINKNELKVELRYREINDFIYSEAILIPVNISETENSYYIENYEINDLFDYKKSYDVQLIATDLLSSSKPIVFKVIKGIPVFDWGTNHLRANELFIADKNAVLNDENNTGTAYDEELGGIQINANSLFLNRNKIIEPNVICACLSSEMTAPTNATTFAIPTNSLVYKIGDKLSIDTTPGGTTCIKIGAGVKSILVNGNIQFNNTNNSSSTYYVGYIYRMRDGESSVLVSRSISNRVEAGDGASVSMSNVPIEVQEGDFLIFNGYKTSSTGNATIGEGARTYMTVQVIE